MNDYPLAAKTIDFEMVVSLMVSVASKITPKDREISDEEGDRIAANAYAIVAACIEQAHGVYDFGDD